MQDDNEGVTRRQFVRDSTLTLAAVSVVGLGSQSVFAQGSGTVKLRKNIETLSDTELSNYLHAVNVLKDRPDSQSDSYHAMAQIHNSNAVPCEHGWYLFLPWHRGLLYCYEQALQASDPPRTKDVAIPYYDFTRLPAPPGQRYPAPFEDTGSVLSQMWTDFGWKPTNRAKTRITSPFYTASYMRNLIVTNANWSASNSGTGGNINGFGGLSTSGKGALENPAHDSMHDSFIAGQLRSLNSAADDPIFWSFHAFLDLIWYRWQNEYPDHPIDGQSHGLRGMKDTAGNDRNIRVADVIDVRRQLAYDYVDDEAPVMLAAAEGVIASSSYAQLHPHVAEQAGKDDTEVIYRHEFRVPRGTFRKASLVVEDFRHSHTVSYRGYVYVYPATVRFEPKSELFRERYLAEHFAVMAMPPMPNSSGPMHTDISFDLSGNLGRLAEQSPGSEWIIAVVATGSSIDYQRVLPQGTRPNILTGEAARATIEFGHGRLALMQ